MATGKKKYPEKKIPLHPISKKRKKRVKILLAEDDVINQKVVTGILERLGYNVDIVSNGKDVVKALEQTSYDLVLMDCQMPEMDGYEATREIRDRNSKVIKHKVPVIALTGNAMEGDMIQFINAGMNDYLLKPVKPKDLYDTIEKWLLKKENPRIKKNTAQLSCNEENIIDLSILTNSLSDNKKLIKNILDDFIEYLPGKILDLKKAFNKSNASSVRRKAHTIKGSSANVGAVYLRKIAHQIEIAGASGDLTDVEELLSEFDKQLMELKKVIAQLNLTD